MGGSEQVYKEMKTIKQITFTLITILSFGIITHCIVFVMDVVKKK